ncbi:hypothetical protein K501DRAFT_301964 [Backusella circina FSU 941]|nr:hypothetical protein K501DRAFT_301964 [Backusella circina FSU 941]
MSVLTIPPSSVHHYFYQPLNLSSKPTLKPPKQIIPSVPRTHFKAPVNSSLSPIRSQKVVPKQQQQQQHKTKRPFPLLSTFSSAASLPTLTKRKRKVSFNQQVMVVVNTVNRRHSAGEADVKPILIYAPQQRSLDRVSQSFKHLKSSFIKLSK